MVPAIRHWYNRLVLKHYKPFLLNMVSKNWATNNKHQLHIVTHSSIQGKSSKFLKRKYNALFTNHRDLVYNNFEFNIHV